MTAAQSSTPHQTGSCPGGGGLGGGGAEWGRFASLQLAPVAPATVFIALGSVRQIQFTALSSVHRTSHARLEERRPPKAQVSFIMTLHSNVGLHVQPLDGGSLCLYLF